MYPQLSAKSSQHLVSSLDPNASIKCRVNICSYALLVYPSLMFAAIDREDLIIWDVRLYFSELGKLLHSEKTVIANLKASL